MKIRKLQLKNIGVFDDEEIEFKECPVKDKAEIHILTGENGTGKTTILMALASSIKFDTKSSHWNIELLNDENLFLKRYRENSNFNVEFTELTASEEQSLQYIRAYHQEKDAKHAPFLVYNCINLFCSAVSGYRRIKDEPIKIAEEVERNPLYRSLDFVKDENAKFTVNQWLGHNLINSSLAQSRKKPEETEKFNKKVQTLENVINDIIAEETKDTEIRFEMQSATKLVLIKNNEELDFDVLPDGLKSLISWIGDLLMRLDSLKWENDTPIFDREIILFLDEIEVHLHPAWQRKVLPIVQKLFKNAQIFVSTHSPFVVNSVDDAWVYKLKLKDGKAKVEKPYKKTENSQSITQVLREVFDIYGLFGKEVQDKIDKFEKLRDKILSNGTNTKDEKKLLKIAKSLYDEPSDQVKNIVKGELQQLSEIKGKEYLI